MHGESGAGEILAVALATNEPMPLGVLVLCGGTLVLGGLLLLFLGWQGAHGTVHRNHLYGFRTKWSLSSDAAWATMHRVAAPWSYAGGAAMALGGALAFALPGKPMAFLAAVTGGTALSVCLLMIGTLRGNTAVKREASR
ncbi:SdpI family protein [Streptomyces sp. NPDC051561]|uniref:SdpI family protein n=1 Tax=Streptomyces sp. NPDC051561 TaxID=3365658 RepID=UPI0037BCB25C